MIRSVTTLCLLALAFVGCQPNVAIPAASNHLVGYTLDAPGNKFPTDSSLQLKAWGHLYDGSRVDLTSATEWTSSEPSIARVGPTGIVSLIGVGTSRIEGRYEDRLVVIALQATAATLESLELDAAAEGLLALGDSRRFTATAVYSDGQRLDVTSRSLWRTDDDALAQVTSTPGTIVARGEGLATVAAVFGGHEAAMNVDITRARMTGLRLQAFVDELKLGELRQLHAFARYSDGGERDITADAQWASSEPSIVFHGQPGMILASALGASLITVEFNGVVSTVTLSVREKRLLGLELERSTWNIAKGLQQPVRAFARFDDRSVEEVASEVQWSSSDVSVATVSLNGVIETHQQGTATITATLSGLDASLELIVGAPIVVRLSPTFAGGRLVLNQSTTLKILGVLSDGTVSNITSAVRVEHGSQLFTDLLGDRLELRATSLGGSSLSLEYGSLSHRVLIDVSTETVTNIVLQSTLPSARPTDSFNRFRAMATWSDGAITDVSELGSWWVNDSNVVEVFDEPGVRGFFTLGAGGKAEVFFQHPEQQVQLTWDFDPRP